MASSSCVRGVWYSSVISKATTTRAVALWARSRSLPTHCMIYVQCRRASLACFMGSRSTRERCRHPMRRCLPRSPSTPISPPTPPGTAGLSVICLQWTMGADWDELSVPYTDPTNSETAMDMAADRYRFILGAPVVTEPGKRWLYSGGATALLARIIAKGTGKTLDGFARETLFNPLGVGPTEWLTDRRGEPIAASGLRMTPRDLARIGSMMLKGGVWGKRRVVPARWIERSTSPMVDVDEVHSYGYLWYSGKFAFTVSTGPRWDRSRLQRVWSAIGNGGQRLYVLPGLDLAVAITAGNYDTPDQWVPPARVMREVVLPSIL